MTFSKSLADSSQLAMNQFAKKTSSSEPVKTLMAQNWRRTECEIVKADFEWNILIPFEFLDEFFSPSTSFFPFKGNSCFKSTLSFSKDGRGFRILLNSYTPNLDLAVLDEPVRVKVSLFNSKRQMLFPKTTLLPKGSKAHSEVVWLDKNALSECFQEDGSFSIYCEIETWTLNETGSGELSCPRTSPDVEIIVPQLDLQKQVPPKKKSRRQKRKENLEKLFNKMELSDVSLVVGDREFHVHKTVIASRSPALAALFTTPGESSTRVQVEDVDPDVFQEVLRFIYTGKVPLDKMEKMEAEIYVAAHKFQLDALKHACVNYYWLSKVTW
ncbi:speckle-type POZ protein-like [Daphnia carinata]|uniref:speckle-type POZ protein-like n=1 Tax=Daphnia carinata TaxID=120202 RepID=UPI00257B5449|nr:speckle-type POZ protein-like [Daphnia carinata]